MSETQPPFCTTMMGALSVVAARVAPGLSTSTLYGASGHGFVMCVHDELCPSGPYCWEVEHLHRLLRNLGIELKDLGFFGPHSTLEQRASVEQAIRENLDQGHSCTFANLEHQVITGYDEAGFQVANPWESPVTIDRLTYGSWSEFGDSVHCSFSTYRPLPKTSLVQLHRESLAYAGALFLSPRAHARGPYKMGPLGYDAWLSARNDDGFNAHGHWWCASVYAECRTQAALYLKEIGQAHPKVATEARRAHDLLGETAEDLSTLADRDAPQETHLGRLRSARDREMSTAKLLSEIATKLS